MYAASVISCMFALKELQEGLSSGAKAYFSSGWNFLDLITYTCVPLTAFYTTWRSGMHLEEDSDTQNPEIPEMVHGFANLVLSMSAIWVWLNLTAFLRPYTITGPFVRMVIQVVVDMKAFMTLMVIYWFSFGLAFSTLLARNPVWNGWNGYINVFAMIFGQTNPEDFSPWTFRNDSTSEPDADGQCKTSNLGWSYQSSHHKRNDKLGPALSYSVGQFYLIAYMVMIGIVLLNLLIAIMGNAYDKIRLKQAVRAKMDRADIIAQLDSIYASQILWMWNFMIRHWKRKQLRADREPVPHEVPDSEEDLQRSNGVYPKYLHILGSVELLQDSGSLRSDTEDALNGNQILARLQQLEDSLEQTDAHAKALAHSISSSERAALEEEEKLSGLVQSISVYLQSTASALATGTLQQSSAQLSTPRSPISPVPPRHSPSKRRPAPVPQLIAS
jgi:hypothetical protein